MRLRVAWATDPGLEREENEDAVVVWRNKAGLDTLLVVCDGMGGHAAGQTASSIASKTITRVLAEDGDEGPDVDRLKRACKQANTAVFEASEENPEWKGMGSTVVVVAIRGGELGLLNVGDSPAYLFRNGSATAHLAGPLVAGRAGAPRRHQAGGGGRPSAEAPPDARGRRVGVDPVLHRPHRRSMRATRSCCAAMASRPRA